MMGNVKGSLEAAVVTMFLISGNCFFVDDNIAWVVVKSLTIVEIILEDSTKCIVLCFSVADPQRGRTPKIRS